MPLEADVRHDARRKEVLAVAAALYAEQGYRATSMRDLAARVGLSKPALYHYFTSKEEVLTELYANLLLDNTAAVTQIAADHPRPLDALRAVIVQRVAYTCENQALLTVCFQEEHHLPPQAKRRVLEARRTYDEAVLAIVERAVAEGSLVLSVAPRIYVNAILGAANWTYKWFDVDGSLTPGALGEQIAAALLDAGARA